VVGAAAVFIVCQRSPAPVRDQGESNLVLWPIFLPFSPSLLSFHLHPCTDPPLTDLMYHYFSVVGCFRSKGGCQLTRCFRGRGGCQIELQSSWCVPGTDSFLWCFWSQISECLLISFPLKHYRWMWRFWTKPWRHLLLHWHLFCFSF
jgi:hypothetical protein